MTQGTDTGMAAITRMLAVPAPGMTIAAPSATGSSDSTGSPGFELNIAAGLTAAIGNLVTELEADRRRKEQLALDVSYVTTPGQAIAASALPGVVAGWGPNARYVWAVQRITLAGFGATSDFITLYRGNSSADALPANALNTLQEAVAGGVATWHPGRTGLILAPEESLVFGGTFTGAQLVVSADVIQLATVKLPYFLL